MPRRADRHARTLGVLLAVVLATRLLALPQTVWEQDEAYLALAVAHFDPAGSCPQPPWFPLWVALGWLGHQLGLAPARALQLWSLAASVATLVPLVLLWRTLASRLHATLAALLFLATPVAWLCAGRALSETPATAALVTVCALWCGAGRAPRVLAAGSLAGGVAHLLRPQQLPAVALPALIALASAKRAWERALVVLPGAAIALVGLSLMLLVGGGWQPFRDSLRLQAALHFGQLGGVSYSLASSGLARGLLHPGAAAAWLVLALLGGVALFRQEALRRQTTLVLAALAGALLSVYGVASPEHARYFIPILALSSGPVVAGAAALFGRAAPALVVAAIAAFAAQVVPGLASYRTQPSPPLAALRLASRHQETKGATIVVDRRLDAFLRFENAFGARPLRAVRDWAAELEPERLGVGTAVIAVYDRGHPLALLPATSVERVSWPPSAVRRLSPNRFVDVAVAAATVPASPPSQRP